MKRNSKLLLVLSIVGSTLFSCGSINNAGTHNNQNPTKNGQETSDAIRTYAIINASMEYAYLDGLKGFGVPGETYSFRVTLMPGYHFNDQVSITTSTEDVAFSFADSYYTFVMPSDDVTITVSVGKTDYTVESSSKFVDKIILDDDSEEEVEVRSAIAGTKLKFKPVYYAESHYTEMRINGKKVDIGADGYYHFVMPVKPVVISSDEVATPYNISINDLSLSTCNIYTDNETKLSVNTATYGQTVYLDFSYEVIKVRYNISVKTVAGEDEVSQDLTVSQLEDTDVYYFTMVAKDVTINVEEKDVSAYYNHPLTNKDWKTYNAYGSSTGTKTTAYSSMSSAKGFTFKDDATGKYGSSNITWEPDSDNPHHVLATVTASGTIKDVYYTDHIIIAKFNEYASSKWNDASVGTYSSDYVIHQFLFKNLNRFFWIEDEEHNILENILVYDEQVYVNVTLKDDEGNTLLGDAISTSATFTAYDGETNVFKYINGTILSSYSIDLTTDSFCNAVIKNEAGEEITSIENTSTVYIYASLNDGVSDEFEINTPVVSNGSSKVTVTEVADTPNAWSFTMPAGNVTINVSTYNPNKYAGYSALGTYTVYNLYESKSDNVDFSQTGAPTIRTFDVNASGTVVKTLSSATTYEITSFENTIEGTIGIKDSSSKTGTIFYHNDLFLTTFNIGNTDFTDVWIGMRLPEGAEATSMSTKVHWMHDTDDWAFSLYLSGTLVGSVFVTNKTVYMGVEFTFEEGSEEISNTSNYHVVKNGVTLFDVNAGVVTAAE